MFVRLPHKRRLRVNLSRTRSRRHLAEATGFKKLCLLIGSGYSFFKQSENEFGIPMMGPSVQEFQALPGFQSTCQHSRSATRGMP